MNVPLQVLAQIQMMIQSIISLETLCSIVKNLSIKYFFKADWRNGGNGLILVSSTPFNTGPSWYVVVVN